MTRMAPDASLLTLPIRWAIGLALAFAAYAVNDAVSTSQMRSELREIRTLIDSQKENLDLKLALMRSDMEKSELRKALLERLNPETK